MKPLPPTEIRIAPGLVAALVSVTLFLCVDARAELRAGAAAIDITPVRFPVLVNGNMLASTATQATSRLHARAVVVADGREHVAIVVVDSCMMPRPLLDQTKRLASMRTGIPPQRMLISATHTHTAPASMGCLGTDADPAYVPFLRDRLVQVIAAADSNLQPARIGWAVSNASDYTALRRWVLRPDRMGVDPFGNQSVRANMHAASNRDNVTGESGPEDPDLSMISFQSPDGRPIALLANFSMHYFAGVEPLNADYFGLFCGGLEARLGGAQGTNHPPFVTLMSHGCSGDIWRKNYANSEMEQPKWTVESYAAGLVGIAHAAYPAIHHESAVELRMEETRLPLNYRTPDLQRLEWARRIVKALGDRPPRTTEEVYAREQILLHEQKSTEVVIQAIRMGDIAIASTPCETFALTGLKLKLQSPLPRTLVIELANGGDGYIPPPEQHHLGGYTTWPARSAGLEVSAEPRIAETAISLLERVAGRPRRRFEQSRGSAATAILRHRPAAYWRLDEFSADRIRDYSGHHRDATSEPGVVFFLEGPRSASFCESGEVNRAAHFAGGRIRAALGDLTNRHSISMWFWNGMPHDARATTGWMISRGPNHGLESRCDHVGLGGTATQPGKLIHLHGDDRLGAKPTVGRTQINRWTWNHLAVVRNGDRVRLYLNGNPEPEIDVPAPTDATPVSDLWFFGGRSDNQANWEGRLDEIAVFDRALTATEVSELAK